jgi:hypothetical protein
MNTQAIFWDCGRPARNAREARKLTQNGFAPGGEFAGGTPAVPASHLTRFPGTSVVKWKSLYFRQ